MPRIVFQGLDKDGVCGRFYELNLIVMLKRIWEESFQSLDVLALNQLVIFLLKLLNLL